MKCQYCKSELKEKRNGSKYCNDHCRSMNWKSVKRLRKIKEETRQMIEKANIQVNDEVKELYNKIFGK